MNPTVEKKMKKMIDFEKEFEKMIETKTDLLRTDGDICWLNKNKMDIKTIKGFIRSKLLQQIEEDNKRFLGYIGEDEKDPNPPETFEKEEDGVISDKLARNLKRYLENNNNWESRRGRNQLRQELRDKVK